MKYIRPLQTVRDKLELFVFVDLDEHESNIEIRANALNELYSTIEDKKYGETFHLHYKSEFNVFKNEYPKEVKNPRGTDLKCSYFMFDVDTKELGWCDNAYIKHQFMKNFHHGAFLNKPEILLKYSTRE